MQVNILESKNRLSELVRRAAQGEEIVIATRGVPTVRLVPVNPPEQPRRDVLAWLRKHAVPHHARRGAEQIDAGIQQERDAWD
jgi:prevent-host-death family protein